MEEHTVKESDDVSVCFTLSNVSAGFIQAPIWILLTTVEDSARGVCDMCSSNGQEVCQDIELSIPSNYIK